MPAEPICRNVWATATELLKRAFLGWLRGERGHCSMARVPTIAEEDAKRPNRERDCLGNWREFLREVA